MLLDKIPVLLLTGYLGSGKTTLLNRILSNRKGIRFAVIVNDIGEVNIDAELIQKGGVVAQQDDNLIALQNGCICCSLKMDLIQQLRDLCTATFETAENSKQHFDYIVIEASGICEPAPIAQTICSYRQMVPATSSTLQGGLRGASIPKLDAVVTVVDALRLRDEFISQLSSIANSQSPKFALANIPDYATNNAHMFYLICNSLEQRTALIKHLKDNGIQAVFHYLSLHSSPYYIDKHDGRVLPECARYADCLVRLPMFYDLTDEQALYIVDTIKSFAQ